VRSQTGTNWKSSRRTRSGTRGGAVYSVHSHVLFLAALRWRTSAFRVRSVVERVLCHGAVALRSIHKVWIVAVLLQFYYLLRDIVFLSVAKIVSLITDRQSFIAFVIFRKFCLFVFDATAPQWARASSFLRFLDHTQRRTTVGRTPLDEWSARHRDLYLTTNNTHNTQTSRPLVGFKPTISAGERPQTHVLDRAATGTGIFRKWQLYNMHNTDNMYAVLVTVYVPGCR